MPTYEYACDACGFTFEKEQRITESPTKRCPSCGKPKARRMIGGGGGFILKGGGWYSDLYGTPKKGDSKDDSKSGADAADPASKDSSDKKGSDKADKAPKDGGPKAESGAKAKTKAPKAKGGSKKAS